MLCLSGRCAAGLSALSGTDEGASGLLFPEMAPPAFLMAPSILPTIEFAWGSLVPDTSGMAASCAPRDGGMPLDCAHHRWTRRFSVGANGRSGKEGL